MAEKVLSLEENEKQPQGLGMEEAGGAAENR